MIGALRTARRWGSKALAVSVEGKNMTEPTVRLAKSGLSLNIEDPVELALGSLVSCEFHMAQFAAKKLNVTLDDIQFQNVKGALNTAFFEGDKTALPQVTEVSMDVLVKTGVDKQKFDELIRMIEQGCPLYYLFKSSGTKMNVNWKQVT